MARITKRGRNPGVVDNWLDNLGLYRKNVAYDETCLFRAVSEQLYDCQVYHERVRKECIAYARENFKDFSQLVKSCKEWQAHLNLLEKHMVVCGNIEINIVSKKYKRDIIIYDAAHQKVCHMINNYSSSLRLCLMDEDHYDVVYKREHIMTAGFCQSMVYKVLYERVFHIPNVDEIVRGMLYEKNSITTQSEMLMEKNTFAEVNNNDTELVTVKEETEDAPLTLTNNNNIAPFPFKVAKALDPLIYRNIEYDSWGEVRREMRLGEWYYGDNNLILGTRCILNDRNINGTHECFIQEIIKDQNKCVVYLTKLAEKRTVNYSDLSPEKDAKPWPLPYRFSKNLVIAGSPQVAPGDKTSRTVKKRNKDKRRTKSESSTAVSSEAVENISAYVGVPLQMQNLNDTGYRDQEVSTETQTESIPPDQMITQEVQTGTPYEWNQPQWHHMLPTPESIILGQTPTPAPQNVFNFNMKPMVASAPVTPDVVPYHESNYPLYYNYQVDPGYHAYNQQWQPPPIELQPPPLPKTEVEKSYEDLKHHHAENETNFDNYVENETTYEHPTIVNSPPRRPTLCTTLTPQTTPVEMYSPMMVPTPVLYARPMSDMIEMVMTSPPIINSPPIEMHYAPSPYVYPPTPPAAWYPAGINSQGFIFPPPRS